MSKTFTPLAVPAVAALSTSTGALALTGIPVGGCALRVYNKHTEAAHVRFGRDNTVVATTDDMPIAPGTFQDFEVGDLITHMAHITTGTPTLKIYACAGHVK